MYLKERLSAARFSVPTPVQAAAIPQALEGKDVLATAQTGTGKTLNIGSGGVLFTTEQRLPLGRMVEISVNWPARLDGTCPLKFVASGRIIRSEADRAAVRKTVQAQSPSTLLQLAGGLIGGIS